ncbi:MAG TPA: hypothetical protein VF590_16650, partial [Isosphaeraceae bacterium]
MRMLSCTGGRFRQVVAVGAVLGLMATRAVADPLYSITDLGAGLGPHSEALAINDAGRVVGEASERPFLLGPGAPTAIGGGAVSAVGINGAGQV